MNRTVLLFRGLRFHRRSHFGIFLGTAAAAAVMTGALLVGDSVRHTLTSLARARLGRTEQALESGPRFLSAGIAEPLEEKVGRPVAPLLQVRAVALRRGEDGRVRSAAGVRLFGVDDRFRRLAPEEGTADPLPPPPGSVIYLNGRAARELGAGRGDIITLRIAAAGIMPLDAPLSSRAAGLTRLGSFTVGAIAGPEDLGNFNLRAEQIPPANVFVDLTWLQEALGLEGRVNVLLAGRGVGGDAGAAEMNRALARLFRPADGGYSFRTYRRQGIVQLESERIFLDPLPAAGALALPGAAGSLTWLVNSLSREGGPEEAATPYSFVAAVSPSGQPGVSPVPEGMGTEEIILNRWAAGQLQARPGDRVMMTYFTPTAAGTFVEKSRTFTLRSVVPMEEIAGERDLVPPFPGLTDVDACRDWDIGMPLDREKLADRSNESYWRLYRQTPKAFVTLAAGREMWSTRWGDVTAVRYPARGGGDGSVPSLPQFFLDPADIGYFFVPVADAGAAAVAQAVDFGGLFLGMSLFLITSALALTGMLHAFAVRQRAEESGTLLALGFSPWQVARLYLSEGAAVAFAGAAGGALLGIAYGRSIVHGLGGVWSGAVAGAAILYHGEAGTIAVGGAAAFLFSLAAIALTVVHQKGLDVRDLLSTGSPVTEGSSPPGRFSGAVALAGSGAAAAAITLGFLSSPDRRGAFFFSAGAFLLITFIFSLQALCRRLGRRGGGRLTFGGLALRNALRRRWRSTGAIAIFACGVFIVVSVSSMRSDFAGTAGTGGFELYGESALPVLADRLDRQEYDVLPVKVHDGDDASCFNLNRARAPRLLGIDPGELISRRSFLRTNGEEPAWNLLGAELPGGTVPGLAGDGDTALWNLGVKTGVDDGDEIVYRDERGGEFRVRIVGALPVRKSIFQGSVLISERAFVDRFPSEDGYRIFLYDTPSDNVPELRSRIEEAYSRQGMDVTGTAERLAAFYDVEHTYLRAFSLLGGLGLVLASLGMTVVVLRNIAERRAELALLGSVGFSVERIGRLLLLEHAGLYAAGLGGGTAAALLAVLPALIAPGHDIPVKSLFLLLAALLAVGTGCITLAVRTGARGSPLSALGEE